MGMKQAYAIMQQVTEKKEALAREAMLAERQQKIDAQQKRNTMKQSVFPQEVLDQLLSDQGYKGYRVTRDMDEWQVEIHTKSWGWEHIDTIGFHSRGRVKMYKTLSGVLKRAKKEIEAVKC